MVDAGHIAVGSDLVDKEAIRAIQSKRSQQYTEKDYRQLESLMYDKVSLRLEDAQVIQLDRSHIWYYWSTILSSL